MLRKAINYILITLIALQSVVAFADAHQFSQTSADHVSAESKEFHNHEASSTALELDEIGATPDDCNHCCHCHGSTSPFLDKVQTSLNIASKANPVHDYAFSNTAYQGSLENPPPIA